MATEHEVANAWLRHHNLNPDNFDVLCEDIDQWRTVTYVFNKVFADVFYRPSEISKRTHYADFVMEGTGTGDHVVVTKDTKGSDGGGHYSRTFLLMDLERTTPDDNTPVENSLDKDDTIGHTTLGWPLWDDFGDGSID